MTAARNGTHSSLIPRWYGLLMPRGRPSPKIAITVDPDVHEMLVEAAEEDGLSVSAWVTEAVRRKLKIRDGLRIVAEWEAENGPFTEEELAAADRWITEGRVRSRQQRSR